MNPRWGATLLLIAALVAGCSSTRPAPHAATPDLGHGLAKKITVEGMVTHLRALQDIANANGGNRADGTPGFNASVDYVAKALRDKGFDVQTPQFDRLYTVSMGKPSLTVAGRTYPVDQASLLVQTAARRPDGATDPAGTAIGLRRPRLPGRDAQGRDRRRRRHPLLGR